MRAMRTRLGRSGSSVVPNIGNPATFGRRVMGTAQGPFGHIGAFGRGSAAVVKPAYGFPGASRWRRAIQEGVEGVVEGIEKSNQRSAAKVKRRGLKLLARTGGRKRFIPGGWRGSSGPRFGQTVDGPVANARRYSESLGKMQSFNVDELVDMAQAVGATGATRQDVLSATHATLRARAKRTGTGTSRGVSGIHTVHDTGTGFGWRMGNMQQTDIVTMDAAMRDDMIVRVRGRVNQPVNRKGAVRKLGGEDRKTADYAARIFNRDFEIERFEELYGSRDFRQLQRGTEFRMAGKPREYSNLLNRMNALSRADEPVKARTSSPLLDRLQEVSAAEKAERLKALSSPPVPAPLTQQQETVRTIANIPRDMPAAKPLGEKHAKAAARGRRMVAETAPTTPTTAPTGAAVSDTVGELAGNVGGFGGLVKQGMFWGGAAMGASGLSDASEGEGGFGKMVIGVGLMAMAGRAGKAVNEVDWAAMTRGAAKAG